MTIQESTPPTSRKRAKKSTDSPLSKAIISLPAILAERTAESLIAGITAVTAELEKLNAAMDRLMVAKGDAVRPAVEALAEQLIAYLDATASDPDLEDDDPGGDGNSDDEPSLGAAESANQERAWSFKQNPTRDDRELEDEDGDELAMSEVSDLELSGESDAENGDGTVDDEPSLGSLDGRMSQAKWALPDYMPRGCWGIATDAEDDGLVGGEGSGCDRECGGDDMPCDEAYGYPADEKGVTWPPISNANDEFGGVA